MFKENPDFQAKQHKPLKINISLPGTKLIFAVRKIQISHSTMRQVTRQIPPTMRQVTQQNPPTMRQVTQQNPPTMSQIYLLRVTNPPTMRQIYLLTASSQSISLPCVKIIFSV